MTTTVTDQLLRDLVVGSHTEGTTCLAVAIERPVPLVAGTGERRGSLSTFTLPSRLRTR
jgi:hypothetical protein